MYDASKILVKRELDNNKKVNDELEDIMEYIEDYFEFLADDKNINNFRKKLKRLIDSFQGISSFDKIRKLCMDFTDEGAAGRFDTDADTGLVAIYYLLLWMYTEKDGNLIQTMPGLKVTRYTEEYYIVIMEFEYQGEYMTICDMADIIDIEEAINDDCGIVVRDNREHVAFSSSLDELIFCDE